jgi:hypothetical protein
MDLLSGRSKLKVVSLDSEVHIIHSVPVQWYVCIRSPADLARDRLNIGVILSLLLNELSKRYFQQGDISDFCLFFMLNQTFVICPHYHSL